MLVLEEEPPSKTEEFSLGEDARNFRLVDIVNEMQERIRDDHIIEDGASKIMPCLYISLG
jgi:hypothetical protein